MGINPKFVRIVEILEFNFVYVFGLNPKMGMDFMGFDLDENLGFMVIFGSDGLMVFLFWGFFSCSFHG
jgi:hypothetical protein